MLDSRYRVPSLSVKPPIQSFSVTDSIHTLHVQRAHSTASLRLVRFAVGHWQAITFPKQGLPRSYFDELIDDDSTRRSGSGTSPAISRAGDGIEGPSGSRSDCHSLMRL